MLVNQIILEMSNKDKGSSIYIVLSIQFQSKGPQSQLLTCGLLLNTGDWSFTLMAACCTKNKR